MEGYILPQYIFGEQYLHFLQQSGAGLLHSQFFGQVLPSLLATWLT